MSSTVQEREPGLGRLDQERAASLADEGGASAIEFEARDERRLGATQWPPKRSLWMAGIVLGFLAAAAMARIRRPGVS